MPFIRVYLHLNRQMSCLPLKLSVIDYGKRVSVVTIRKDINNKISKRQEANGRGYEIQAQYHFFLTEISWWQGRLGVRLVVLVLGSPPQAASLPHPLPHARCTEGGMPSHRD